jgi:hypothetical protein
MPAFRLVSLSWWSRKRKVDVWWGKMMGSRKLRITNFKSRTRQSCRAAEVKRWKEESKTHIRLLILGREII